MHADDIRTLAISEETLTRQIALVKTFAEENLLKLNTKCYFKYLRENVPFPRAGHRVKCVYGTYICVYTTCMCVHVHVWYRCMECQRR